MCRNRAIAAAGLLVLLASVPLPGPARAQNWVVTSLADAGPGTLRQALADAAAGDLVTFDVVGTIRLARSLVVTRPVTVRGPGPQPGVITLSGGGAVQVLRVDAPVRLEALAIVDGSSPESGGGIEVRYPDGHLTALDCVIQGNSSALGGGGLAVSGAGAVLERCVVSGNRAGATGGGMAASAPVVIRDSTIADNAAAARWDGGGIYSSRDLRLERSAVVGNRADEGGGLWLAGIAVVANSTVAHNAATEANAEEGRAGGIYNGGQLVVVHSTIAGNSALSPYWTGGPGGGIMTSTGYSPGPPTSRTVLINSLVAHNEGGNCGGGVPVTDDGGNLQYPDATCGASIPVVDPQLGALAGSGDVSPALPLAADSPARDAAPTGPCRADPVAAVDQHGRARPVDGDGDGQAACDIGAVEAESAATPTPGYTPAATTTPEPADLVVSGAGVGLENPGNCADFGSLVLHVSVANLGATDSGPFVLEVNGERRQVRGVAPRGGVAMVFGHGDAGPHAAYADADDAVRERDESNNGFYNRVPIPTLPPRCDPSVTPTPDPRVTPPTPRPTLTPAPTSTAWNWPDLYFANVEWRLPCSPGGQSALAVRPCIMNTAYNQTVVVRVVSEPPGLAWDLDLAGVGNRAVCLDPRPAPPDLRAFVVDPDNRLPEAHEDNNRRLAPAPRVTPASDCTPTRRPPTATRTATSATPSATPTGPTATYTPRWSATPSRTATPAPERPLFLPWASSRPPLG